MMHILPNFCTEVKMLLFPSPKNYQIRLESVDEESRLFLRRKTLLAASGHEPFLEKKKISTVEHDIYSIMGANILSSLPFCFGILDMVYSN